MINNDILRSIRYALDLHDSSIVAFCKLGGHTLEPSSVTALLKKEEEEGFLTCTDLVMGAFLDGLILQKRGKKENDTEQVTATSHLTNNVILKKLRIALELQEDTLLAILEKTDTGITRARLSALFRKEGHKNYKECGDQFLRNFLKGLALHLRAQRGKAKPAGQQSP
jgi:uncharacterized protein YehS (DUF1456 family)